MALATLEDDETPAKMMLTAEGIDVLRNCSAVSSWSKASTSAPLDCPSSIASTVDEASPTHLWWNERTLSSSSFASCTLSGPAGFGSPSRTLLILDWDDTLFPSIEIFVRWKLPGDISQWPAAIQKLSRERKLQLESWQNAVYDFFKRATELSDGCVIITNARRGWVDDCVRHFAPRLKEFFAPQACIGCVHVVYALEDIRPTRRSLGSVVNGAESRLWISDLATDDEEAELMTTAKYAAMSQAATDFYAMGPDRAWTNIISIGDAEYERDALHDLQMRYEAPSSSRLRAKALRCPAAPSMIELSVILRLSTSVLPACAKLDGDLDVEFGEMLVEDGPVASLAAALQMPEVHDNGILRF